jgi:hypothetical protein
VNARAAMPDARSTSSAFINRDINDLITHDLDSSLRPPAMTPRSSSSPSGS